MTAIPNPKDDPGTRHGMVRIEGWAWRELLTLPDDEVEKQLSVALNDLKEDLWEMLRRERAESK